MRRIARKDQTQNQQGMNQNGAGKSYYVIFFGCHFFAGLVANTNLK